MKKSQLRNIIRESIKEILNEQSNNPFDVPNVGSGPNWQAAQQAWATWSAQNQTGAPQPPAQFLASMNQPGRTLDFYKSRYTILTTKFFNLFPDTTSNLATAAQSNNPAWQSQLLAKIYWLADKIRSYDFPSQSPAGSTFSSISACFTSFITDTSNDTPLNYIQPNGNPGISTVNRNNMKMNWNTMKSCTQLNNKLNVFMQQMSNLTPGSNAFLRKQAKGIYLTNLKQHCCI